MKLLDKLSSFRQHLVNSNIFVVVVLACLVLSSCNSKEDAIQDLLDFRTGIKNNCQNYTQLEWQDALERYNDLCERVNEYPLTEDERREVDKIKGEIAGYAATVAIQKVTDEVQNIADEIEAFGEGFSNTFEEPKTDE